MSDGNELDAQHEAVVESKQSGENTVPEFIKSLRIEGFRALSNLRIENLGKVNLITGKNNSGKSSLLEAIRILATGGALKTIYDILNYREEWTGRGDSEGVNGPTELTPFCNLFNGFPDVSSSKNAFSVSSEGRIPPHLSSVSVKVGWFIRRTDPERRAVSYESASIDLFDDADGVVALEISLAGRKRIIPFERFSRSSFMMRMEPEASATPCVYLDPFSSRSTMQMGALWDAIALTDAEQEIVKALKVISEDILAVSVIGSDEGRARQRTAIARSARYPSPIPLRTFGDGVNRLFGIILSLCNARNGVLLVDEIENGLHYSVQAAIWRTVFRLARDLNVQVFATSHSWDCVHSFQIAACESPEDGVLVRLTKKGEEVTATLFSEKELEIATREQIEVR